MSDRIKEYMLNLIRFIAYISIIIGVCRVIYIVAVEFSATIAIMMSIIAIMIVRMETKRNRE